MPLTQEVVGRDEQLRLRAGPNYNVTIFYLINSKFDRSPWGRAGRGVKISLILIWGLNQISFSSRWGWIREGRGVEEQRFFDLQEIKGFGRSRF